MTNRVLFIDEDQGRNGSTVSMEYLVEGFHARGYDVYVLSWKSDPRAKEALTKHATVLDGRRGRITTITLCVHFLYTFSPFSPS
ncbi:MAG: hypothetical protein WBD36_14010, partial [Bacteroidota bacterium]